MPGLSVLTWNINSPSEHRAQRQLDWLATRGEDVFVLTETKASDGCALLAEGFQQAGYSVVFPTPAPREHGVMIASKVVLDADDWSTELDYLPSRAATATAHTDHGPVRLIGVYAPSRDASPDKVERKQRWLREFSDLMAGSAKNRSETRLLLGDLNVIEPDHTPRYPQFLAFEYDFYRSLIDTHDLRDAYRHTAPSEVEHSWVGRTGDGYRYDHVFCSPALTSRVSACHYVHEVRLGDPRLSDHSALAVYLDLVPLRPLVTSDPSTAASPPTLF